MAGHGPRLTTFVAAVHGDKSIRPFGDGNRGSLNFKKLDRWTAWLIDPSPYNEQRCLDMLEQYKRHGHLTIQLGIDEASGGHKYACEQGSPGMHGVYNFACGLAGMLFAKPSTDMFAANREFVLDEFALCREFVFRESIYIPAPRVKDEERAVKGKKIKPMLPTDGYRDDCYWLVNGGRIKKKDPEAYWSSPQSIGIWCLQEILKDDRRKHYLTAADVRKQAVPRLFMPLTRIDLRDGGFMAYADDTPIIRTNTIDVCNWLIAQPGIDALSRSRQPKARTAGVTLRVGYDWEPVPEIEPEQEVGRRVYGGQ